MNVFTHCHVMAMASVLTLKEVMSVLAILATLEMDSTVQVSLDLHFSILVLWSEAKRNEV